MRDTHPASQAIDQLLADCSFERTRRGGPGGQHRNKTESAIVVTHVPTSIIGQASERRSQHANRTVAVERLRVNLALGVRAKVATESYSPSDRWRQRAKGGRLSVSVQHEDYAALLAEALDVLLACGYEVPAAGNLLGVSSSQLIKLLRSLPAAMDWLNQNREKQGLGRLK